MNPIRQPAGRFFGQALLMTVVISFPLCGSSAGEPGEKTNPAWNPPIEVATGNGHRGPWRGNNSEYDFVDDAAVAVNDHGYVAVAWADLPQLDLFLRLYAPDGTAVFEEAVNVSRSPEVFSWIPRLVMSDGATPGEITIHAIWQDIVSPSPTVCSFPAKAAGFFSSPPRRPKTQTPAKHPATCATTQPTPLPRKRAGTHRRPIAVATAIEWHHAFLPGLPKPRPI